MAKRDHHNKHARLGSKASQSTTTTHSSDVTVTLRADHQHDYQRELTAACARGNEERVRRLLTENEPWTTEKHKEALRKALQKASARHHINIIRLLLHYGAEVNAGGHDEFPPLYRAAQAGQRLVVEELLAHRPDVEAREMRTLQTPLFAASVRGFHDIVSLLIAKGARVNAQDRDGRTPLLAMATNPNFTSMETASLLADHGANLDAKDQIGRTPLLWAATNRNYDLARTLLEKGANVSAVNNRGRTALHLTVDSSNASGKSGDQTPVPKRPREEMLLLLLQHGADANAASDGGWRPLHNAAQKGLKSIVEILLKAGADINATLSNGMTALHWAAFNGFEDVAQLIWSYPEADLNIKDTFGRAAWLCAAENGHDDLVELLSPGHNSHRLPKSMLDATQAFNATVVEFKDYGEKQRISKPPVSDLLYRWDEKNGRPAIPLWTDGPPGHAKSEFKWIHLPANNLAWVETLMINWFIESGCRDLEGFKALMKCLEQEHRGPLPHANYMRPFCQRISSQHPGDEDGAALGGDDMLGAGGAGGASPLPFKLKGIRRSTSNLSQMTLTQGIPGGDGKIVMFMPYLHYETDESRQKMMDAIKIVSSARNANSRDKTPDLLLLEAYLNHKPPLHPRRTLDQFFYRGIDTSARDRDQVVYRYCEAHGHERKVFMVDQLWVLVLNKDLIITCFPERWDFRNHKDPLGVLDGIVGEMNAKTRPPVRSVYHMAILISGRCSGMFSRHRVDDQDYQFLDMFESSVGRVTEDLTHLFHQFEQASAQSRQWARPSRRSKLRSSKNKKKKAPTDEFTSFDRLLDIGNETSLLTEVRDIRDELNILTMILNSQLWTLGDLKNCLMEELSLSAASSRLMRNNVNNAHVADIRKRTLEQERHLKVHKRDIQSMDEQAERLYQSLTDLLDLKQKHSNALEARFASEQALAAARSGQTVMVFTIVTIIFLPMSFIAAYFGINIDSFDHLTDDYVATWTFGGGLSISLVFIFMAFTVVDITRALNSFGALMKSVFARAGRGSGGKDGEDGDDDDEDYEEAPTLAKPSGPQTRLLAPPTPSPLHSAFNHQQTTPLSHVRTNNTMRSDAMEMGILKSTELDLVKMKTAISILTKTRSATSAANSPRSRRGFGDDLEWGRHDREMSAETY